jgi:hypothetical protein
VPCVVVSGCLAALAFTLARPAAAADSEPTVLARQHFERGYAAAQRGELELAVLEFERAYAARPNASVLFNLGQAYASAGRAAEAVSTLKRYLELSGSNVPPDRRALVDSLIEYHSRALGEVQLDVSPAGAEVTLDGRSVGLAPFAEPLKVLRGTHVLVATLEGHERHVQSFELKANERVPLEVSLVRSAPSARVRVTCAVPDVDVSLDGRRVGRTPLQAAIATLPGARVLELGRAGYFTERRTLELRAGGDAEIPCTLRATAPTPSFARLALTHPAGTRATLDERPFTGQPVPAGRHRLVVSGPGFERVERMVTLPSGGVTTLSVLPPVAGVAASRELAERGTTQRVVSYVLGGTGLALGATALGLFVYNNGEYERWQRDGTAFTRDYARDPRLAPPERLDALLADEREIRNRDALAIGAGALGGALVAGAVGLYLTAGSSEPALTITGGVALSGRSFPRLGLRGAF